MHRRQHANPRSHDELERRIVSAFARIRATRARVAVVELVESIAGAEQAGTIDAGGDIEAPEEG